MERVASRGTSASDDDIGAGLHMLLAGAASQGRKVNGKEQFGAFGVFLFQAG